MTKQELLAALRAATGPSRELDAEVALLCGWTRDFDKSGNEEWRLPGGVFYYGPSVLERFTASLDAANAFRERMLPGCEWGIDVVNSIDGRIHCAYVDAYTGNGANAALALCAAVIAALIAQETNHD